MNIKLYLIKYYIWTMSFVFIIKLFIKNKNKTIQQDLNKLQSKLFFHYIRILP